MGRYIEGSALCTPQYCTRSTSTGYQRVMCDQQNCDIDLYEGRYTVNLPQGATFDEDVPKQCFAGFVGDSTEAIRQTSPFCARVSEGGATGSILPTLSHSLRTAVAEPSRHR